MILNPMYMVKYDAFLAYEIFGKINNATRMVLMYRTWEIYENIDPGPTANKSRSLIIY